LQEQKKQNFLKSAAILAAASILVKIIGAIYKIPIFNILDDGGRGSFQVTYNVYTLILTISTAGLPAALSRLISSAAATGKMSLVKRYFSVSLPAFVIIGFIAMLAMFLFADSFAGLMNDSLAAPGIRVLAPAVFFVCIISVYRGYAQGFENMIPTAISQVVEVICKAAFGIAAAMILTSRNYAMHLVSAGAILGVTVGLGLCIPLLIWYKRKIAGGLDADHDNTDDLPSRIRVCGQVFKVSIPITLSASFMAIMTFIDTSVVLGRLQDWLIHTDEVVAAAQELVLIEALPLAQALAETAEKFARTEFGIYTLGQTVYNLPLALVVPVSVSIIPAIAAAIARNRDDGEAGVIMQSSVKLVNLIAMPAAAGLMILATPILIALYNDSRQLASTILVILGAASFFACLQYITTAILQANGHERAALMTFPVGAAFKIVIGYFLAGNPKYGIIGSPIGTLACFMAISVLNIVFILLRVKEKPKFTGVFIRPLICTAVMAGIAYGVYALAYWLGSGFLGTGRFAVIAFLAVAMIVAMAVYGVLIIATRTITKEDMLLIPKGEKLAAILRIR